MRKKIGFFLLAAASLVSHTANAIISKKETEKFLQHFRFINNKDDDGIRPLDKLSYLQSWEATSSGMKTKSQKRDVNKIDWTLQNINFEELGQEGAQAKREELVKRAEEGKEDAKIILGYLEYYCNRKPGLNKETRKYLTEEVKKALGET